MRRALIAAVAAMLAAGCGSNDDQPATPPQAKATATPRVWDEFTITNRVGLVSWNDGVSWEHAESGCQIAVVLTTPAEVELYAGAGDTVAATPDRSAGVKITDSRTATCLRTLTEALADL